MDYPGSNEKKIDNINDFYNTKSNIRNDNLILNYTITGGFNDNVLNNASYNTYYEIDSYGNENLDDDTLQLFPLNKYNNWYNYNRGFRKPSVKLTNSMVIIEGVVNVGNDFIIGFLPEKYRPNGKLLFSINNHDNQISVSIDEEGIIKIESGKPKYGWLSLNGIIYMNKFNKNSSLIRLNNKTVGNIKPIGNLIKNEIYGNTGFALVDYQVPNMTLLDKLVVLQGVIQKQNNDKMAILAHLANELIPQNKKIFNVSNFNGNARIEIDNMGYITDIVDNDNDIISLAGVVYSLDKGTPLNLLNGWNNYSPDYDTAQYNVVNKLVIISGLIYNNDNKQKIITKLPDNINPKERIVFNLNQNKKTVRVDLFETGELVVLNSDPSLQWISLNGIVFSITS